MRPLAGKTALVTGAARGIGRAIALRLAGRGMRLALADRDVLGLAAARREIERLGVEAIACPTDLCEPNQVDELAELVLDRWSGVDLLVNNAGVAHYGPTHEMAEEDLQRMLAVNLLSPIRLTRALLPSLRARPEAHVLNVCSVLGLAPMPRVAAYCTTKHGLVGFGDSLRIEYGRQGLGVTTLCPGFVRTPLLDEAVESSEKKRRPPALVCVSIDRVARAAVRGVERNRRRVVVDPVGRVVRGAMSLMPGVFDRLFALGRAKRIAQKREELAALSPDEAVALRMKLTPATEQPTEQQRAA